MSTATLTAIPSFAMILFCEYFVTFFGEVIITLFQRDNLLHSSLDWNSSLL